MSLRLVNLGLLMGLWGTAILAGTPEQNQQAATMPSVMSLSPSDIKQVSEVMRSAEKAGVDVVERTDEARAAREVLGKVWDSQSQKTLTELVDLHEKLYAFWMETRKKHSELSDEEFSREFIEKSKIMIETSGIGKAELTVIGSVDASGKKVFSPLVKIAHEPTQVAYLFVEKGGIDYSQSHWKLYLARQHIMAGTTRKDGQLGRDVVVIEKIQSKLDSTEDLMNPEQFQRLDRPRKFTSLKWWAEYARAMYKAPDVDSTIFGVVCGVGQAAMGLCAAGLKTWTDPSYPLDLSAAKLSFLWGSGVGTFASTYVNWTNHGSQMARTLKSAANGYLFGFMLIGMTHKDGFNAFNIFDTSEDGSGSLLNWGAVGVNAGLVGNVVANNYAKVYWNGFARVRELSGVSQGKIRFTIPGWGHEVVWSRRNVENQAIYLAPFSIRLLDQLHIAVGSFPLGQVVLWGSIPAVKYGVLRYTKRLAEASGQPQAMSVYKQHQRSWDAFVEWFKNSEFRNLLFSRMLYSVVGATKSLAKVTDLINEKFGHLVHYSKVSIDGEEVKSELREFAIPGGGNSELTAGSYNCHRGLRSLLTRP